MAISKITGDSIDTAGSGITPSGLSTGGPYWNSNGNVGIGTNSPTYLFEAKNTTGLAQFAVNDNTGVSTIQQSSSLYINAGETGTGSSTIFRYGTSRTESMRIDSTGNIGINNGSPTQYASSGKVLNITGVANNSGPSNLFMAGASAQTGAGYASTEVFAISGVTSAREITRVTGTGANGFRAYFKVIVTGHTGSVGNGINIKEYFWDGATTGATQISTYTNGQVPSITITNSTNNVLIINLASSDGSNPFNGVMKVEWMLPIDFASSTYTIS